MDRHRLAQVALHSQREEVLLDAVRIAHEVSEADSAFAAVDDGHGSYDMTVRSGLTAPQWPEVSVKPGRGLGGQVLIEGGARTSEDYLEESTITGDYQEIMRAEGLHGIACVPVAGPEGTTALLYVSNRCAGTPGDRTIAEVDRIAEMATVGLSHIAARAQDRELAVLCERQRLAAQLHDTVAQTLFAIGVAARESSETDDPEQVRAKMREVEARAGGARRELRESLARLSHAPERLAFEAQFEAEVRLFERRTGRAVWVTRGGEPRAVGRASEDVLLSGMRESLSNAGKHGAGPVVLVHLAYDSRRVVLSVQSEVELPSRTEAVRPAILPGSGLGLLRDRVQQCGGELELSRNDDRTSVLRIKLPA